MKTKFGVILILLCLIALSADALAVNYTFKTTVTRTESRSIVPDNSANCDGSAPSLPTINYNVTLIDSNFTQFTIKIVKKSDNSDYFGPVTAGVTHGGNFNLATGELTYTITGITKTNEILIVKFYKGASAAGTPDAEQEISVSSNTRPQAGYVTFGNVGNGASDGGSPGSITGFGGFITNASINNGNTSSNITINFTALDDANYTANVSLVGISNIVNNSQVTCPVIYSKTTSSLVIFLSDVDNPAIQDLRLDIVIQSY